MREEKERDEKEKKQEEEDPVSRVEPLSGTKPMSRLCSPMIKVGLSTGGEQKRRWMLTATDAMQSF